jgi:hypothetical protein
MVDDKIIRFGKINRNIVSGTDALLAVRDLVAANENRNFLLVTMHSLCDNNTILERISLVIERGNENRMHVIRLVNK